MATRLADRYEGKTRILRYGIWGTNTEIEKREDKFYVVYRNKQEKEFPSLEEAEIYVRRNMYKS